jgi:16S rRNA (guanine1516-N2)-methyltransferase
LDKINDIPLLNEALEALGFRLEYAQHEQLECLQLVALHEKFSPLLIDFAAGTNNHRRLFGGGRGQPLARAVGIRGSHNPDVLDLTGGLGRDAFVLATLGCQVTLTERQPVIASLLNDALCRAHASGTAELKAITGRMSLVYSEAENYLNGIDQPYLPETIYMDPMYPHRDKSALVKKEMRIFRLLAGDDEDAAALLPLARQKAVKRVVVKRPKKGELLGNMKPDYQIDSPNTRYDIYLPYS